MQFSGGNLPASAPGINARIRKTRVSGGSPWQNRFIGSGGSGWFRWLYIVVLLASCSRCADLVFLAGKAAVPPPRKIPRLPPAAKDDSTA